MKMIDKIFKTLKKVKLKNIIILLLILAFNTYAWFIYATKVSMGLEIKVSAWNVEFVAGEDEATGNIRIELDSVQPGMEDFEKIIEVHNKGETPATLDYEIKSLKVLEEYYEVSEETGITEDFIKQKIAEYPFKIEITKDSDEIEAGTGNANFTVSVRWPYESGNDELDTKWGNAAYEYHLQNPDEKSIVLNIDLIATQSK